MLISVDADSSDSKKDLIDFVIESGLINETQLSQRDLSLKSNVKGFFFIPQIEFGNDFLGEDMIVILLHNT